jgi:hypothetical protein
MSIFATTMETTFRRCFVSTMTEKRDKVPIVPRGRFAPTIPNERRRRKQQSTIQSEKKPNGQPQTSVESCTENTTKNEKRETTPKTPENSCTNCIKQEPKVQTTTTTISSSNQVVKTRFELESSDEEYMATSQVDNIHQTLHTATTRPSSLLPVVLPSSSNSTKESQQKEEKEKSNLKKESVTSQLLEEKGWFFVQLPPILPIPEREVREFPEEKEETVDENSSLEAKMQELKYLMSQNESQLYPDIRHMESCKLGTLRLFPSGRAELIIHGMTCEVLQGAETNFLEKAMQVDWEKNSISELGDIRRRLICVPNVHNQHHKMTPGVDSSSYFMKMEGKTNS